MRPRAASVSTMRRGGHPADEEMLPLCRLGSLPRRAGHCFHPWLQDVTGSSSMPWLQFTNMDIVMDYINSHSLEFNLLSSGVCRSRLFPGCAL